MAIRILAYWTSSSIFSLTIHNFVITAPFTVDLRVSIPGFPLTFSWLLRSISICWRWIGTAKGGEVWAGHAVSGYHCSIDFVHELDSVKQVLLCSVFSRFVTNTVCHWNIDSFLFFFNVLCLYKVFEAAQWRFDDIFLGRDKGYDRHGCVC